MAINCYPLIFKIRVVEYYKLKKSPIKELLSIFKINKSSLYNWVNLDKNNKLEKKKEYTKTTKYTKYIKEYICRYVIRKINFDHNKLIKLVNKKYNINCSKSKIYEILKEKGVTRKRIKIKTNYYTKKKMTEKTKELRKLLKKVNINDIISIDESSFDTHINSEYGWNEKGQRLMVNKKQQRKRYSIISAISKEKVINVEIIQGSVNAEIFTEYLKKVIEKVGENKIIFMDNARIHHSKILKRYTKTIKNEVIYNIPYCSEINPIEMVFSKVKKVVHKRHNNENMESLKRNIIYGFKKITKEDLKGYYDKSFTF